MQSRDAGSVVLCLRIDILERYISEHIFRKTPKNSTIMKNCDKIAKNDF